MRPRQRVATPEEEHVLIPADLYEEILHRLPSDDLLKLKIVCKDWLRLISSPGFIQKHLERSKAESRIVVALPETAILGNRVNRLTSKKINAIRALGSCDGLVLYMDRNCKIGALNPSTRKSLIKPSTEDILRHISLACTWFGRHPATGEYVLVIASKINENLTRSIVFQVYSLIRNSLLSSLTEELVHSRYLIFLQDIGTFLRGRLHVMAVDVDSCPRKFDILAYDLQANRMLTMFAHLPYDSTALGVVDGCLCALNRNEVWMMKEYGVNESWTKYAKINIDGRISISLRSYRPNDDVILSDDFLKAIRRGAVACIDSLVSPAVVWGENRIV